MHALDPLSDDFRVATKRVSTTVWILRLRGELDDGLVDELWGAFRTVIDEGARDVVVDLGDTTSIGRSAARAIADMAGRMLELDSVLWLATRWSNGDGHSLRPIREPGTDALLGLDDHLDEALHAIRAVSSSDHLT